MKKLMAAEIAVLALLLVAAVIVLCVNLAAPAFTPGNLEPPATEPVDTTPDPTVPSTEAPTVPEFTWATVPAERQMLASQYFVYDCNTGTFLTSHGNEKVYPASITKLFTAYVALQYLQPDTKITAGDALDMVAWGSSVAKIRKGDVLTVEQLVEAMMLPSGNDAAYLLACEAGRIIRNNPTLSASSAVSAFMSQMNEQAAKVGMKGTHFTNPDGIHDSNHYSTFSDLAILGKLSLENATIMKYAVVPKTTVTLHNEEIEWKNTNALINPASPYYCPYAIGLKTGQTPSAGSCLLSAFQKGDTKLIIGVFGCPEENDRFDDTLQLFNQIVLK